ncbi:MAG TPA: xanthine dehydrogenase family protein subunit M [Gemmatimonadaceae bacterium]
MIPSRFDYVAPASLDEAIAMLGSRGGDAKVLSGGQSLIPMLKLRLAAPALVVDINHIPALAYLEERDGALRLGALARERDVEESAVVRERYPILLDTARVIADPLVRNSATVCGNVAHGDPGNDHPATMLALGASIVARGPNGERTIPAREFFVGLFTTALADDEIVTEIVVPTPPPGSGGAYLKLERKVGDYATAAVAAQVTLDADGTCARAGIALTNVGPTAIEAAEAERFLAHEPLDAGTIDQAARLAAAAADPVEDRRGTPDYKRDMVRVLATRALRRAARRARGERAADAAGRS